MRDGLAECQLGWPNVPILFLETRALAQEWTYRLLAAVRATAVSDRGRVSREVSEAFRAARFE